MSEKHDRREFLDHGVKICAVFCAMGVWRSIAPAHARLKELDKK